MEHEEYKRTARLSDAARDEVLDRLDAGNGRGGVNQHGDQRRDERRRYRQNDIAVSVEHPGGGYSRLLLFSRNLSAGGISFVHNGFLYPNSPCRVALPRTDGDTMMVAGTIVRCRHVAGLFHEIGLKFEHRVDPDMFLDNGQEDQSHDPSTLDVPELLGRVGVVEASKADAALTQHYLKLAGVTPMVLNTTGAALDLVKHRGVDIILSELNVVGCEGVEFISKLRQTNFTGPITVMTADADAERLARAVAAGANYTLGKPFESSQLLSLVVKMNQEIGTALTRSAIYSTVDDDGLSGLVAGFIEQARNTAGVIEQAAKHDDYKQLRELCLGLKGSASGFGFAALSNLARETLNAMDVRQSVADVSPRLRTLCTLCQRLKPRPKGNRKPVPRGRRAA